MEELDFWLLILEIIVLIFIKHFNFLNGFCIGLLHYCIDSVLPRILSDLKFAYKYRSLITFAVAHICIVVCLKVYKFISEPCVKKKLPLVLQKCPFDGDKIKVKVLAIFKKYSNPFTCVTSKGNTSIPFRPESRDQVVYPVLAMYREMDNELRRTASFYGQNNLAEAIRLAHHGFYWDSNTRAATCYSCGRMLTDNEARSFRGEAVHEPHCCHVCSDTYRDQERHNDIFLNTSQRRRQIRQSSASHSSSMSSVAGAAAPSLEGNEHENKSTRELRQATFEHVHWLTETVTAERLAMLGFRYDGSEDFVICCHCRGLFHHWNGSLPDLIKAHKEYREQCPFAQLKGI